MSAIIGFCWGKCNNHDKTNTPKNNVRPQVSLLAEVGSDILFCCFFGFLCGTCFGQTSLHLLEFDFSQHFPSKQDSNEKLFRVLNLLVSLDM